MSLGPYTGANAARHARRILAQGDTFANVYALGRILARSPELAEAFVAGLCAAAQERHGPAPCAESVERCFDVLDTTLKAADPR